MLTRFYENIKSVRLIFLGICNIKSRSYATTNLKLFFLNLTEYEYLQSFHILPCFVALHKLIWCCHAEGILPFLLDSSKLDNFGNPLKHQTINRRNFGRNNLRYPPNILISITWGRGWTQLWSIDNGRMVRSLDIVNCHKLS